MGGREGKDRGRKGGRERTESVRTGEQGLGASWSKEDSKERGKERIESVRTGERRGTKKLLT